MTTAQPTPKDMLEHVWRYFALHASQRISLFNYFVIIAGSLSAGLAACLQRGGIFNLFGVGLGCLLMVVSFVFWKLDQRSGFLVKLSENSIVEIENALPLDHARVFSREPVRTAAEESDRFPVKMWTYGKTFRFMFSVMAVVGAAGGVFCLGRYLGWWT